MFLLVFSFSKNALIRYKEIIFFFLIMEENKEGLQMRIQISVFEHWGSLLGPDFKKSIFC